MWEVQQALQAQEVEEVRALLRDIDADLSLGEETGLFLVRARGQRAAGCLALRRLNAAACELRSLYVQPAHRGLGLGRRLAASGVAAARLQGFQRIFLELEPEMAAAQRIFSTLGFAESGPFTPDPAPGRLFLALVL
jgi:N-acetylglutamate synthase-like GNAT family acetyltransferase